MAECRHELSNNFSILYIIDINISKVGEYPRMNGPGLIYSLVSRGRNTILSSESQFTGNFSSVALDILEKVNLSKIFTRFQTKSHCFYIYHHEGFIYLAFVSSEYETELAVNYLKSVQQQFEQKYPEERRKSALAFSLKEFNKNLKEIMSLYNDRMRASKLKLQMTQQQQTSSSKMETIIDKQVEISVMVKASQQMAKESYEVPTQTGRVERVEGCQKKKVVLGIIGAAVVVVIIVVLAVVLSR